MDYILNFAGNLDLLAEKIAAGKIHYVVFCHGADSHEHDDMSGQCTTEEWLECSRMFYRWVNDMDNWLNRPLPLTLSLFGGYRADHYESVLSLHAADLSCCMNELCKIGVNYTPNIKPNINRSSS